MGSCQAISSLDSLKLWLLATAPGCLPTVGLQACPSRLASCTHTARASLVRSLRASLHG